MTLELLATRPSAVPAQDAGDELRISRRVAVTLPARFMRENRREHCGELCDISVGGASFVTDPTVTSQIRVGERIISYVDKLGGIEAVVVRVAPDHFAVRFLTSQNKREKLAGQLTYLANKADLDDLESRHDERFALGKRAALLATADGVTRPCLILDVSLSGASIALSAPPEIGTEVWLGRLRGRIIRHHEEGAGLQFMEALELSTLMAYFG